MGLSNVVAFTPASSHYKTSQEIRKDHYDKLPSMVCETLDRIITKYSQEPWFIKAWNEYRKYVFKTSINNMRMPGLIFKKYVNNKQPDVIRHYGIKGMRWGVRRFQNPDGSLNKKRKVRTDGNKKETIKKLL
jgi:hypothetical protein